MIYSVNRNPAPFKNRPGFLFSDEEKARKKEKSKAMITIATKQKQFEIHISFSTDWIERMMRFTGKFFSMDEIRRIEKLKQKELHEMGLDLWSAR